MKSFEEELEGEYEELSADENDLEFNSEDEEWWKIWKI